MHPQFLTPRLGASGAEAIVDQWRMNNWSCQEALKQRAFDHLDRGDLKNAVASFVGNMNARPDCELPQHLATLGASLLTANDALGWRTLIEELR